MNSDKSPENIPSKVFDWIQQYSFAELTNAQQQEVLGYFSEQTYQQLHETTMQVRQRRSSSKAALMERFDEKHKRKVIKLIYTSSFLWKAAAALLLFSFMALQYFVFMPQKQAPNALTTLIDTVYITKTVASDPIRIHDTVVLIAASSKSEKGQTAYKQTRANPIRKVATKNQASGLYVLSIQDMNAIQNNRKGNSIKDDSLLNSFTFVGS